MPNLTNAEPDLETFYASERLTYRCKPRFIRINPNNDHITCVNNETNGNLITEGILDDCVQNVCPAPNFTIEHTERPAWENSTHNFSDRTVLHYKCQKGFTPNDSETIDISCDASSTTEAGNWNFSSRYSNCTSMH